LSGITTTPARIAPQNRPRVVDRVGISRGAVCCRNHSARSARRPNGRSPTATAVGQRPYRVGERSCRPDRAPVHEKSAWRCTAAAEIGRHASAAARSARLLLMAALSSGTIDSAYRGIGETAMRRGKGLIGPPGPSYQVEVSTEGPLAAN